MESMGINNNFIISEGETYEEALTLGLKNLGLSEGEVSIDILEEKKGSFFKKGHFKLRIIPLKETTISEIQESTTDDNLEVALEMAEDLVNHVNSQFSSDATPYIIEYKEDGVYLTINNIEHKDTKRTIEEIINLLNKKSVKNYEVVQVTSAFEMVKNPVKIAPPQVEVFVDSTLYYEISKDKLEAKILVTEPVGGKYLNFEDLKRELLNKKIIFGVKEEVLKRIAEDRLVETWVTVAEGKEPINGFDGRIEYYFDTNRDLKPKYLEDGSVDYKQLNLINNVKQGDTLAQIFRPTSGVPGTDVFGSIIPAKRGKEVNVRPGKNIAVDSDGLKFTAERDGQVYIAENKLNVSEVYEVPGDVDTSTGNISFNGTVAVRGNVKAGFSVEATGDIHINGVVEAACLKSKGNIVLSRGIQGNNQAVIEAGGNLVAKYVENAQIKCLGDIHVDFILHSDVVAKGKIILNGKKALVVGGDIKAGEEIRARIIGSHMGTATRIEVGIDPEEKQRYDDLKNEILEIERNSENLKKTIDLLSRMAKTSQIPKSKEEILVKSLKTYQFLKGKYDTLTAQFQQLETKIQSLSNGKVHCSGKIYPGVKVIILNSVRFINDELDYCTLYKKEGEVTIGPYEK